jgi:formate dehydrogenase assembly factor FdhD
MIGIGEDARMLARVELAIDRRVTLCGFARGGDVSAYSRPDRVT